MNKEKRTASRHKMNLPIRLLEVGGETTSWIGQTLDIGAGGVSFLIPIELTPGKAVRYEITLSSIGPVARIHCEGFVLRCVKEGDSWLIAATMTRYVFVKPDVTNPGTAEEASSLTFR